MTNPLCNRCILVVEDEMMVAWLLKDMVTLLGYAVAGPAARVKQALALLEEREIDAALIDVNLNGQSSYPIAEALAARDVPFAFSTGYEQSSLPQGYRHVPFLQKPFRLAELGTTLATLLPPPTFELPGSLPPVDSHVSLGGRR